MGVKGLKTFVEDNDDLLIKNYELHDTTVIVDASNLISRLIHQSESRKCSNMAEYERSVGNLFDCFRLCNVKPILVFDGDKTRFKDERKVQAKHLQALERFQEYMLSNKRYSRNLILCSAATQTFKSIATELGHEIVQCVYEADLDVAKLSQTLGCPVMSNDTDFYLINLPSGLISIDLKEQQKPKRSSPQINEGYFYINCCFFHQDHFTTYFPNLDKKNLPLLAVLCGNDLVHPRVFEKICQQLPSRMIADCLGLSVKQFKKLTNRQHVKIVKVLYYLCDKSLNEAVNCLCSHVPKNKRSELKKFIKKNIAVYETPADLDVEQPLSDKRDIDNLCDKFESL